ELEFIVTSQCCILSLINAPRNPGFPEALRKFSQGVVACGSPPVGPYEHCSVASCRAMVATGRMYRTMLDAEMALGAEGGRATCHPRHRGKVASCIGGISLLVVQQVNGSTNGETGPGLGICMIWQVGLRLAACAIGPGTSIYDVISLLCYLSHPLYKERRVLFTQRLIPSSALPLPRCAAGHSVTDDKEFKSSHLFY
ncbi:hypothetical protein I7I51_08843, partial [Histoplasma capsulatum]